MNTPKAPADLWRTILRLVTEDPTSLNMQFWHSNGQCEATSAECGTAHCIAGWVVALTPGGIELVHLIEGLLEEGEPLSDFIQDEAAAEGSAEAAAALAIIYESGWQPYVTADDFFSSNREALILLNNLARLEEQRESQTPTVDRQAITLIP